ncbi:cytochrome b/b6 domain-containing protein [Paracoccus sp. (in: a-proteobacteria)]|uniref:cytochrome b/b6 domain-containing protein n=1 Tax=Paracoccus sp. TaxID=267 RepID=UPI0026DF9F08|nr:cytochrome b/b6 domain-containing protein [Paracoccus sp. (in: a-proteobacteria)]MDO5648468.1 cytochrome b/b6 domain-containing protein [Paracoccus sp. (in: a-proteobacteria)]
MQTGADKVRVWDPFLRIFHWLLAVLVIANWLLGQFGPAVMTLHFWLGYATLALIAMRIVWGFVGPETARFTHFIRGPGAVIDYARHMPERRPSHWFGHNPLGALSVVAILAILLFQIATGLVGDPDDYINIGPLAPYVSRATTRAAVGWHQWGANVILGLVVLHVAVILFYRLWKHEDLIRPMITGWKWVRRR